MIHHPSIPLPKYRRNSGKKKILKEFFVVKKNEASFGLFKKILCVKIGILKIEPYLNLKI
jgi:hypothetical protein